MAATSTTPAGAGRPSAASPAARPAFVGGAVVLLAIGVAWLAGGVVASDALVYAGYTAVFVVAPGCLLERLLRPEPRSALDRLAIGWALGYVIEIAAFMATAAAGIRWALPYVLLGVAAAAGAAVLRSRRAGPAATTVTLPAWVWWAAAGIAVLAVARIAWAYFTQVPLPERVPFVTYFVDLTFHLGLVAEAAHHWPVQDPRVVGEALPYHHFAYFHMAAAHQVTGIDITTILMRLEILPLTVAFALGLFAAGRAAGGRAVTGVVAGALVLFVAELHPNLDGRFTFYNTFFQSQWVSPTQLLGLALFGPLLAVLIEIADGEGRTPRRTWLLLALLLFGCAGAKATILPIVLGGLGFGLLAVRVVSGRLNRRVAGALALSLAVQLAFLVTLYRGAAGGLRIDPPGSIAAMDVFVQLIPDVQGIAAVVIWSLAAVIGVLGFCGPQLVGLAAFARTPVRALPARFWLCLGMLLAGLGAFLLLVQSGGSQNFFTYFGVVAATVISADGLVGWFERTGTDPRRVARAAIPAFAAGLVALYAIRGVLPGGIKVFYLVAFALLVALLAAALVNAGRSDRRLLAVAVGVVLAGTLQVPTDLTNTLLNRGPDGELHVTEGREMTRGLYEGLRWVRDHTPPDAVIAVNNHRLQRDGLPQNMNYSAFSERRVFLESWGVTHAAAASDHAGGQLFPDRLALNDAVFKRADRAALRTLVDRYGVCCLVVDLVHGTASPDLRRLGRPAFVHRDVLVYVVRGS